MTTLYGLIWRANDTDAAWRQEEFDARVPRLMAWLRRLKEGGHLVACGGGGFEDRAGGLTLVRAGSVEEATELSSGSPMNEIGRTEIFVWDVFYGDLVELSNEARLRSE
jgi:hypothetical protein